MATHSSILAAESHGQRSLAGYSLWRRKELDTTEWLTLLLLWKLQEQPRCKRLRKPLQGEFAKALFLYHATGQAKGFQQKLKIKKKKKDSRFSHTSNIIEHFLFLRAIKFAKKKGSPPNSLPHVKGIVQSLNRVQLFATPWSAACSEGNRREIILQTDNCNFKSHDHILPQAVNQSVNNSNQNECSNKCFRLSSFRMINSFEITFS